jgi:hypothetical protein
MSYIRPVIEAFKEKKAKKLSNTESTGKELVLFGNTIAEWRNNDIWITSANWKTATTKDRLQILGARLKQKQGIWYLNDVEWSGNWIKIDTTPKTNKIKTSIYE